MLGFLLFWVVDFMNSMVYERMSVMRNARVRMNTGWRFGVGKDGFAATYLPSGRCVTIIELVRNRTEKCNIRPDLDAIGIFNGLRSYTDDVDEQEKKRKSPIIERVEQGQDMKKKSLLYPA